MADQQSDFVATYGPLAQDIAQRTGLLPHVVLGQIAQETGWGQHVKGNNIFGISPGGEVASYPSVQHATNAYINLINSRYGNATRATTPEGQVNNLVLSGYNSVDPTYAKSVVGHASKIKSMGAPQGAPSDDDLDRQLLAPAPSSGGAASPSPVSEEDLDRKLLGDAAPDKGRPSPDFRYVAPYTAPDGSMTTIAPEDYDRFNALIKYDQEHPAKAPAPGEIDPVTGAPVQSMSRGGNSPVAQSTGKPVAENKQPGLVTQAAINLATDPEQRRRIAASQLYPDKSPLEAQSRVFYGPDGRLAAVGENGQPYYVDPLAPHVSLGDYGSSRLGNPLSYLESSIPSAIAPAAGIAAGLATGPGSAVLGPALAAGGAATGDLARQFGARYLDPSKAPPPINLGQTVSEAALAGAGQFGGATLSNALAPNPLRLSTAERSIMRAPAAMADTRAAYANAGQQGVQLTPGQASGLPSLLQFEDAASTMPGTVDQATQFYRAQGQQLQGAGQRMLDAVSPQVDKNLGAAQFQQGADDAIRLTRQNANAAARPAYTAAQNAGQVMSPDLAQLADQPAVSQAMDRARATYRNLYRRDAPDTPDFALWDLTKRQLDDAHDVATRAGERTDAHAIDTLRGDLRTHLDTAYPSYAQARATAAPGQALASQLEDSGVGAVAGKTGDERARAIVAPVFSGNNPQAISRARDAFAAAGRSDEWNAGVRSYIQDAFDKASMSQQGLNPAMLRRQVWGNVDNREAIQAALTPAQFQGFENFLGTIEHAAHTYPMNSLTATRQNARGALQAAGEQQGNVRALDAAATALAPFRWFNDLAPRMLSGVRQRMVEGNVQRIVGHLFSPDGLQYLEAMSRYSPGSLRALEATSQAVSRVSPNLLGSPSTTENNPLSARSGARTGTE